MAKRGRPRKNAPKVTKAKKVDEIDHTQTPEAIEFDREMAIKNGEAVEKSLFHCKFPRQIPGVILQGGSA